MGTERNDRAQQFDELWQRRQAGDHDWSDDPELRDLLGLAERLRRELPEDLPDPAFRLRLKEQLIGAQPPPASQPSPPPPVDLARERRRRPWRADWRLVAAVAALLLIALIGGLDALRGGSSGPPATSQAPNVALSAPTESAPAAASGPSQANGRQPAATKEPTSKEKPSPSFAEKTSFPPLDREHVVLGGMGLGGSAGTSAFVGSPEATPNESAIRLTGSLPELPEQAQAWVLVAPADPVTFLQTFKARLGAQGEVKRLAERGPDDSTYGVVDQSGTPFLYWDPARAYFTYSGPPPDRTPAVPNRPEGGPVEIAQNWLMEMGFDFTTIQYDAVAEPGPDATTVRFTAANLPNVELQPGQQLTVMVAVAPDGAIRYADGFWFSRGESGEVPLRAADDAWAALQAGQGFSPFLDLAGGTTRIEVTGGSLAYLLTRGSDNKFLLQPVVAFDGHEAQATAVSLRLYVSAIAPGTGGAPAG